MDYEGQICRAPMERAAYKLPVMVGCCYNQCNEINMNATVTSIFDKSDEELQLLADNGVKHLYIGLESGLEDVLSFMNKGNTVAQLIEAVKRIRKYGMCFDAHIMTGSAGSLLLRNMKT